MTSQLKHNGTSRLWRRLEGFFDRLGTRPLGLIVFLSSAVLLVLISQLSGHRVMAPAVADGPRVEHPAGTSSYVAEIHVRPGEHVDQGAPIATLSSEFISRELRLVEAEIEVVSRRADWELTQIQAAAIAAERAWSEESEQAQLRLRLADAMETYGDELLSLAHQRHEAIQHQVERGLNSVEDLHVAQLEMGRARARAEMEHRNVRAERDHLTGVEQLSPEPVDRPRLEEPALLYFGARLEELMQRRSALLEDTLNLTIRARGSGHVANLLPNGSAVAKGTSVASIVPSEPTEVIAFLPPEHHPDSLLPGSEVTIVASNFTCGQPGRVLHRGAAVELAPRQLTSAMRSPIYGFPVHISIPPDCQLAVGQTLTAEFHPQSLSAGMHTPESMGVFSAPVNGLTRGER